MPAAGGVIGAGAGAAAGRAATQDHVEAAEKTTVGTGDVGLSATAFPSFQGPWAGLDVPGDIWLATTAPALPTRTQHAVSTARLHPSFLPSGVSRTIEPRQAGRPVAGRPARGRSEAAPPASAASPGSGTPSWTCGRSRCLRRCASPPVPGQLHQRPRHAPGRRGRPRPGSLRAPGRKSSQETPDSPRRLAPAAPGPGPLNRTDARDHSPSSGGDGQSRRRGSGFRAG